ncbi:MULTISPECIES: MarR family winged helix-turn-helix transcriptional regulator [Arthrobacter]|uniref:MarR family transcriptional regulator n=1 Tax=Arthrobacter caoxuetaonis TaxID=2886935 RepID=A0A9X1MGC3_9MICC|nr:MarR family transcriptional regulator [Arthrobacter caoxuetaonis]MCC3284086.1 MarR family transcriptional regulator [Arthrobacter caoxuetaonis]MCC3299589.1 MarR family transcriptional regulator [Arthrobacter caoxuetaonis]MCC9194539.1 MarR family transcriptional regulator [Arthrobacter sp. zg-Y916]USQ57835.1 MarR family transcriptional regulator [Arthrobacter caoxuetaonis]
MERNELRLEIVNAVRGLGLDGQLVADAFAHSHGLNSTDMRALTLIMEAEVRGEPLTAGRLSSLLGTSTGATTAVIDRLERIGHIHRTRSEQDRRKVTLHFEALARQLAGAYFGPLGLLTSQVMDRYSEDELETIHSFLNGMRQAYSQHLQALEESGGAAEAGAASAGENR